MGINNSVSTIVQSREQTNNKHKEKENNTILCGIMENTINQ